MNVLEAETSKGSFQFAFGEHLFVDPASRKKGVGTEIVHQTNLAISRDYNAGIIFSEQNDPYIMTRDEQEIDAAAGISPMERLGFWGKQGYQAVDAPYAQPTLDGGEPVLYLRCCVAIVDPSKIPDAVEFDGKSIDGDAYLAMIRAYHGTFVDDLDSDPTSEYLKKLISGTDQVSLIEIQAPRTFAQQRIDLQS